MSWTRGFLPLIIGLGFLTTVNCIDLPEKEWWETTLVYQIWPRGFQDTNGDGEGDLQGIIERLDYIKDLGVETIWLNPIYASPLIDSGYDISNYTDIHPIFGNFEDFDNLVEQAHDRDLKVILDIVPNHSSDQHEWFQLSAKNIDPYKDYYVWSNGTTDDNGTLQPPNNWMSFYNNENGSAWTWHDHRKEWYYHKFHKSQPDLNLRNEKVIKELLDVFDFWLKREVDGFRINAVSYFFEDEDLQEDPFPGNNTYTFGLPENIALLYAFRAYIDDWVNKNNATSKLLIAESYDTDDNLITYYGNGTHEGIPPSNFRFITHIHNSSTADYIKNILENWFELLPENTSTNWVLSNHDHSRAASRIGLNRVDGLHMLNLLLPGQAYTYYGEEIAMLDTSIPWNQTIDPKGCSKTEETYEKYSRDPARTPMQWNSSISAGFSTNSTTYLPIHTDYRKRNVEIQEKQNQTNIKIYKMLANLRKNPVFTHGDYEFATLNNNNIFILKRFLDNYPIYIVVIHLGVRPENVNLTSLYPNLTDFLNVTIASSNAINVTDFVPSDNIRLTANAALVLQGEEEEITIEEDATESLTTITTTEEEMNSTTIESSTSEIPETTSSTEETSSTESEKTSTESANTTSTISPPESSTTLSTTTEKDRSGGANVVSVNYLSLSAFAVIVLFKMF